LTTSADLIRRTIDVVAEAVLALREAEDKIVKLRNAIQGASKILLDERSIEEADVNVDPGSAWRILQDALDLFDE
jgi:hypothetical protein